MCEHGTTTILRVFIPSWASHTSRGRWDDKPVDACIAPIVAALNDGGVTTASSCCGHGKSDGTISLLDGRQLTITQTPIGDPERDPAVYRPTRRNPFDR